MFCQSRMKSGRRHRVLIVSFVLLVALSSMQAGLIPAFRSAFALEGEKVSAETNKKLTFASAQYDLILSLIEEKNFDGIEAEWKKVLDLKLGEEYEAPIAESLLTIGYKLYKAKQIPLAQKLMDDSLASPVPFSKKDKADILRFKAVLYRDAGDLDSAVKAVRQAHALNP
jgi:tetratricopeptide (TPR) repeat protein